MNLNRRLINRKTGDVIESTSGTNAHTIAFYLPFKGLGYVVTDVISTRLPEIIAVRKAQRPFMVAEAVVDLNTMMVLKNRNGKMNYKISNSDKREIERHARRVTLDELEELCK